MSLKFQTGILIQHVVSYWILAKSQSPRMYGAAIWGLWEVNGSRWGEEENQIKMTTILAMFTTFSPLWYPQGLNSRQPGTEKWTLVWTEFQEKTSRSGFGAERELLKLREDAEVPLPLFPFYFPMSAIPGQHRRGCNSTGARLWEMGAFLSSGWSCDPKTVGRTWLPVFLSLSPIFHHLALWTTQWCN